MLKTLYEFGAPPAVAGPPRLPSRFRLRGRPLARQSGDTTFCPHASQQSLIRQGDLGNRPTSRVPASTYVVGDSFGLSATILASPMR
jgi:hypothetical protein